MNATNKALAAAWLALGTTAAILADKGTRYPFGEDARNAVGTELERRLKHQPTTAEIWDLFAGRNRQP